MTKSDQQENNTEKSIQELRYKEKKDDDPRVAEIEEKVVDIGRRFGCGSIGTSALGLVMSGKEGIQNEVGVEEEHEKLNMDNINQTYKQIRKESTEIENSEVEKLNGGGKEIFDNGVVLRHRLFSGMYLMKYFTLRI